MLHQWLDPLLSMPNDEEIFKFWNSTCKNQKLHPLDFYRNHLEEWRKEGYSAVVMHQLLKDQCSCDVQSIRRYLNKHFPIQVDPVMPRNTILGQDLEIDFGYLGKFLDDEGKMKKAWVFSFRLRHSRRAYREIVLDQSSKTFLLGHIHAFEWFGGVPKNVILDNCKAAIIQSTIDNDMIRRAYQDLAEFYGFIISPCLPRTPEHKEEVLQCTRGGLLSLAEKVGPFTYQVVYEILSHPTIDKLKPVRHLLRLANKYSKERLEVACQRACAYKMFAYISVKNILVNNLDRVISEKVPADKVIPIQKFRFARNLEPYKSKETFEEKLERIHPASRHGNAFMDPYESLLADQIIDEEKLALSGRDQEIS